MQFRHGLALCAAVLIMPAAASAQQLIVNGGFESGDLTGWQVFTQDGSDIVGDPNIYPSDPTEMYSVTGAFLSPYSNNDTPGPSSGSFYALSDENGMSAGGLFQTFTVPYAVSSATLSFDMFISNWNDGGCDDSGDGVIDFAVDACEQFSLADLWMGDISSSPFTAGVAADQYLFYSECGQVSCEPPSGAWESYSFDLSGFLAPGTYSLRFATVDNQFYYNQGIDNVSLEVTPAAVPEPSTVSLLAMGLPFLAGGTLRRRRRKA